MDEMRTLMGASTPTTAENVRERIDAWHRGDGAGADLHRFLGWTWKQYATWVKSGEFPVTSTSAATTSATTTSVSPASAASAA